MPNLTKSYIDKIVHPAKGYKLHWDDKIKGFGVRANSAKSMKLTFIYQGRINGPGMKEINYRIGSPPVWTVDQARKAAMQLALDMDRGIDPRAAKKAEEVANITLAAVADEYVGRPGKLKERSQQEINRHIATTFEDWKDKPSAAITEDMCRKRYQKILTKGLRGKKRKGKYCPAPGQANQGFSVLRALINYAMRRYKKADGSSLMAINPVGVLVDDWAELAPRNLSLIHI